MYMTSIKETEVLRTPAGATVQWLLSEEDGAPLFEMRYYELGPGLRTKGKPHDFEHEAFILEGTGRIEGDEEKHELKSGDAYIVFPGETHNLFNTSETETLKFLCFIPKGRENELKRNYPER